MLVFMTALDYHHQHHQQAFKVLDLGDHVIDNIRKEHFERVCNDFDFGGVGESQVMHQNDPIDQVATLECLHGYIDLFLTHPKMLQSEFFSIY